MSVIEKLSTISNLIDGLFDFVAKDEQISKDFESYLLNLGYEIKDQNQLHSVLLPYILENSVVEKFINSRPKIERHELEILNALSDSFFGVFKIKRVLKNGFEAESIVNEKNYNLLSLVKMHNFRGIGVCDYLTARIFKLDGEYYLLEISDVISSNYAENAERYAISLQIKNPEKLYWDNPQKLAELEKTVETLYKKFVECFGRNAVVTTNKKVDDLINAFNEFCETGKKQENIEKLIEEISEYKFFHIQDFETNGSNFLEKAVEGFSVHSETYDVALYYDENLGLFVIPFYQTFMKIFEGENVQNANECIEHFIKSEKVPSSVISLAQERYTNFKEVVNNAIGEGYNEEKFKPQFYKHKVFSSTTALFTSKVFARVMGYVEKNLAPTFDDSQIGRNDPCPCGSGLKYKKCCMK